MTDQSEVLSRKAFVDAGKISQKPTGMIGIKVLSSSQVATIDSRRMNRERERRGSDFHDLISFSYSLTHPFSLQTGQSVTCTFESRISWKPHKLEVRERIPGSVRFSVCLPVERENSHSMGNWCLQMSYECLPFVMWTFSFPFRHDWRERGEEVKNLIRSKILSLICFSPKSRVSQVWLLTSVTRQELIAKHIYSFLFAHCTLDKHLLAIFFLSHNPHTHMSV